MKNIEVTDEMYDALMAISKEMTSQDPRATRMPHMFQIRTTEEVVAVEGNGTAIWVNGDGDTLRTDEEIKEYLVEHFFDQGYILTQGDFEEGDSDEETIAAIQKKFNELDWITIENMLEGESAQYRKVWVETKFEYKNSFLTAKACEDHIKANHYHYNDPVCYLNHAFRNPEAKTVSKFLCELSGGKLHT